MRKKFSLSLVIILLISFLFTSHSLASDFNIPEASYEFYLYDDIGIVDRSVSDHIIKNSKKLYEETGAQIVLAVIQVDERSNINEYATAMFEEWEIGSKGKDNGVLILIDPMNNHIWIEVGYGLEGALPDSRVKRIIEDDIIPNFKVDDYNLGILNGYTGILNRVEEEYNIDGYDDSEIVIDGYGAVKYDENYKQYVQDSHSIKKVGQSNHLKEKASLFRKIILAIFIGAFIMLDFHFLGGQITYLIIRILLSGGSSGGGGSGNGRGGGSSGGGGRSGGGGAGGSW